MKIEDRLAMQIGALVVENAKKDTVIEAMRVELAKRDEILKKLNDAEPKLPLSEPPVDHMKDFRNGAH